MLLLKMIFLGKVLSIVERPTYHKLVVGVECGYHIECYTLRITNDRIIDLSVDDKVGFTAYSMSRDGKNQFHVESLLKINFASCDVCNLPLTSNVCLMRHDTEAQKLSGQWKVVHKIESNGCIKVFFEQGHFVFAGVSTIDRWFHSIFQNLNKYDTVTIEGWRYQRNTTFKRIHKTNI